MFRFIAPFSRSRGPATFVALLVAVTQPPVQAEPQVVIADPAALQTPLTADVFTEAVRAHNASLEAMRQAVIAAVAQIKLAGSLEDPMLSLSAAPRTLGTATGPSGEVEISQALPWWGTLDARTEMARAEAAAASHDFEGLQLRLEALARGAFSDWVFVRHALAINATHQALLAELRSIALVRYTTGQAPQGDVLEADVQRALLKQQKLELERQRVVIQARMNALLERSPQAAIAEPAELPELVSLPAQEMLAQRALGHPQLQELEARERTAQAHEQLEEKERYPKFHISAGYNNMWADPTMRPMVGLSFTVPIDQDKYREAIDAARAQARRAAAPLEDQRSVMLADLASAYALAHEAAQTLALYRGELVPLARASLEVARTDYGSGRGDFLRVLAAEQHRLDTELGLFRMQSEYYRRLADLEQASGGGLFGPRSSEGADR